MQPDGQGCASRDMAGFIKVVDRGRKVLARIAWTTGSVRTVWPAQLMQRWILVAKPPREGSKTCGEVRLFVRRIMMGADYSSLENLENNWYHSGLIRHIHDMLSEPGQGPVPKLAVNTIPFAKRFRQVTQRRACLTPSRPCDPFFANTTQTMAEC